MNSEHVAVLMKGPASVEDWRAKNPGKVLDLSDARLLQVNLPKANLSEANLTRTDLSLAILKETDLSRAKLAQANLFHAALWHANLSAANLSGAALALADINFANLSQADLSSADLSNVSLLGAKLLKANLKGANLEFSNLTGADFTEANLSESDLFGTHFCINTLNKVNLTRASVGLTTISACDLSQCLGLGTVKHTAPSSIGVNTLISSFQGAGNCFTPDMLSFFVNAGVPGEVMELLPKILAQVKYYTSFVCYGQPDSRFAVRLVNELKGRGVSCWLYSMDATPGERVWEEIVQKRREAEKMIVLCSAEALIRDGVLKEIEEQIDEDPDKLIPISLDNTWKHGGFLVKRGERDLKPFLLERNYADFHDAPEYESTLSKLLRGLKRKEK